MYMVLFLEFRKKGKVLIQLKTKEKYIIFFYNSSRRTSHPNIFNQFPSTFLLISLALLLIQNFPQIAFAALFQTLNSPNGQPALYVYLWNLSFLNQGYWEWICWEMCSMPWKSIWSRENCCWEVQTFVSQKLLQL